MVSTKNVLRRFLSMTLAILMLLTLAPALTLPVYAASVGGKLTGLADTSIDATWTASTDDVSYANWTVQSGTEILGIAKYESGTCSGSDNNTTLILTNNKNEAATLSFTYTIGGNDKIQIAGKDVSGNDSWSKELAAGESVKIYIESQGEGTSGTITLSNISLLVNKDVTTTFKPAENGNYTVGDKAVTEEYSNTQSSLTPYVVKASSNPGYKFVGWYSVTDDSYLTTNASASLNFDSDRTITAVFTASDNSVYSVGTKKFFDLDEATAYAKKSGIEKVTLEQNGKSITGTHTIPVGVTLLIPFDSAATLSKETPASVQNGAVSNKNNEYRTLTLAEGAVLNVEGGINVGGTYRAAAGSSSGYMTGNYGLLNLAAGSSLNIKNGGSLYAWGFVTGAGSVAAESGSIIWEWFQVGDFRGGKATMGMGNSVFPFSQYYVQNIEAPLTIQSGATEKVYTGITASGKVNPASIEFIGNRGMFKLDSGSLTRTYDGSTDRMTYTVNGNIELNSLSLNLAGSNVNSASYILPLTNNLTINVASGKATINQDLALLAGVQMTIAKGADMTIASGKNLYVYDADEWNAANYTCLGKFVSLQFAYSRTKTRSNADLVDAKIDVNGTLTVTGAVYTTAGGANICSEGGGQVIQQAAPGTASTTYQYTQSGASVSRADIPITAAKLLNADGTYEETANAAAGDTYTYRNGKWVKNGETTEAVITYDANGGTGTMDSQTVTAGEEATLTVNTFTREGYTFSGWNTAADGTGDSYADGAAVTFDADTTLYAQWTAETFTVTWVNDNGTVLEEDKDAAYGTTPEYNGAAPTKQGDEQYSYTFSGWTPEVTAVTGDVTYKATYTQSVNTYTVTWQNEDGTVLKTDEVAYNEVPAYVGDTPTKAGDAEHNYTFSGWTPEITPVTGNATYTATFAEGINSYTVIWKNWDGTELEKDEDVEYGTTPEYNGAEPVHEGDAQYSYVFKGWSPTVDAVTGDITYTAVFEQSTNTYAITWKNGDEVLKTEQVAYGEMPVWSGDTPTKVDETGQYTYVFKGWTPEIQTVVGEATYTAEFEQTENTFTVTWVDSDGTTVLETDENVAYGTKPSYDGDTPTKAEDDQYTSTFKCWDPEITDETTVTADVTYKAVYDTAVKTYTVTWKNADGTVLKTDKNAAYGTMPSYDGETPVKASDDNYTYTFAGWDPAVNVVTGDVTYTATYTSTPLVKHTVTFDGNGGEGSMDAQTFIVGVDSSLNANAFTREGYKFTGWNTAADGSGVTYADGGAISSLQEDMTLYAQWQFWNGWLTDTIGTTYYKDGQIAYKNGWATIDGKVYYFNESGYIATGVYQAPYPDSSIGTYGSNENDLKNHEKEYKEAGYESKSYFLFDGNGVFQKDYTGFYTMIDGIVRWVDKGELSWHGCLVTDGTDYYYVSAGGSLHQEGVFWIGDTNELLAKGYYYLKDYKIEKDTDGFVTWNGSKYYLENGRADTRKGLIKVGDDYYYIKSNYTVVCGTSYYVSNTNDLMPAGTYTFDSDGKMIIEKPGTKNGLIEENGDLYYYVDGVKTHAGLIKVDGGYYYINSSCKAVKNCDYYVSNTNGLMKKDTYHFGVDCKMVIPDTKNGLIEENNELYYYVDGVKTHAGLIQLDGAYYYINSSCKAVRNCDYYVSNTNNLMAKGTYHFGTDGKMTIPEAKNGLVNENGDLYYYVDGVRTHAGLIQVDGAYYYINSSCKAVKNCDYYVYNTNNLMPKGYYHFNEEGKLTK